MKTNKLKKCILSNSENFNEIINQPQVVSNTNLNHQFWQSSKDTINTKKESQSIKGRIFTAKRISTPIIQELMRDALEQIEAEDAEEVKRGKEVKVLYNNIRANDIWHVQTDVSKDGEEWAMRILREISRDFEQPFDKLHEKVSGNEDEEQSPKDILSNKKLSKKLVAIHSHLANIIERLKERCKPKRNIEDDNDSLNNLRNQGINVETSSSRDTQCYSALTNQKKRNSKAYDVNIQSFRNQHEEFSTKSTSIYDYNLVVKENKNKLLVENACSPINFGELEKAGFSISKKLSYDVAVSYHALFEENRNNIGNKEIVIKCSEDLEKVRNYLEAMRDNKECEKPKFTDLESCNNYACLESQPHLHSNSHNMPMVLKLNKHAEENERNSDLIIGIPSLTKSSPDVHILLNTKNQHVDIKEAPEQSNRHQNHHKNACRVSRIPKPIHKKRIDMGRYLKSNSMRITLENKDSPRRNAANLSIFDPDDPCKSIIKMKEQKSEDQSDSRSVVSNNRCKVKYQEVLIVKFVFCCIGGKCISIWFLTEWFLDIKYFSEKYSLIHSLQRRVSMVILNFSLILTKIPDEHFLKYEVNDKNCVEKINSRRQSPKAIECCYDGYLDNYINNLLNFISTIKGSLKHTPSKEGRCHKQILYPEYNFDLYTPQRGAFYATYFFECFKENKEKVNTEPSSQSRWDAQTENRTAYPMWTIKRSKYYSVPQSKKRTEVVLEQKLAEDEQQENMDQSKLEEVDSLENIGGSHNEIHMQISQVSVHSTELNKAEDSDADIDKSCKKTEIKRKVSFREEVDVSGTGVDPDPPQDQDLYSQDFQNLPDSPNEGQAHFHDMKNALEESPSLDTRENMKKLSSRISDLLMTDSLMQIAEKISKSDTKKLKQSSKRSSPKSLKLTNSARNVLAKLSKSFEDEEYRSVSGTLDSDLAKQFYDKEGNPIAEVYNSEGDLLFKMKENNIHKLTSVLFDSDGLILKNRYDVDGKRIKTVYDENGTAIRRIQSNDEDFKGVQADSETVEYYDYKGKPIKHLYDSSGYEINTVGKDLTSRIFDADGRLQNDIFTKRGRKIDAVYDSDGRLLARVSENQLEPVMRRQQVRVAKMDDDSLNKLFDGGSKSVKFENGDLLKQSESPKRFFDQEGNPLTGVYDKKGKPIKLTSSGEADELLPFLFDNNGKLQSKRFDSKGKELKAVFGEDGKAISEMSIAWLNELLANSKETEVKSKKKESFFKRITKPKTKTERQCNIEKLYDSNGKIITSIFDAKGKPLAVTLSGDANKLIPFLFDTGGKFIKKRYDSEKHKLRCVYGRDGNTITNVSVTYLDQIAAKLEKEQNQKTEENSFQIEDDGNWNLPKVSQEPVGNMSEETKSEKNLDCFDRVPDQIYDEEGNILTEIFDHEGNILVNSSSGNAWKLLPHLFDHEGNFLKKRFDQKGRELFGVYNKDGENLNKDLSKAIKITVGKTYSPHEEIEYHEERNDNIEDVGKKCESNTSIERVDKIDMKQNEKKKKRRRNKSNEKIKMRDSLLNLRKRGSSIVSVDNTSRHSMMKKTSSTSKQVESFQKREKHEKKQLKPTTSITKKQSINQRFDIPEVKPKAGESIDRFYDERGNPIMEVYDSKGRALIRTKSGDVDQLAKILFDKKGFLLDHLYDRKGRRIKQIFDQKRRSISRISMPCIISGDNSSMKEHQNDERIPGSVYDKEGNLVKEIFDKRRHPIIFTRSAKSEDLAPIIFDEKGVRRRVFDKSGYEIGPVYDHKGKEIKKLPVFKKSRPKPNNTDTRIFSKSGRPSRNLYDSEGTLIIALYNDYGKTLCNVKKGSNNVEVLSKFFFDKEGHFLRGRFYNFRGQMIRHIYDSDNNIIRHIQRTESRKIAHHKSSNRGGDRKQRKHIENANKLNLKINAKASNHIPRGYHGRSEVRPVENIMGTFSSQSDTISNPAAPLVQRSMSAYSLGDYPKRYPIALSSTSSTSSLTDMPIKKFYDEHGRLSTGVYNSKTRLLGYTASGNARVLAPYLFDIKGKFLPGRYNLDRKPLKHIYDSNGKLIEKSSNPVVNKNKEKVPKQPKGFKFHDSNGDAITSVYDVRGDKILDVTGSCDKIVNLFDKNGKFKKHLYNYRGSKLKVYEENRKVVKKVSSEEVNSDPGSDVSEERDEDYPSESKGRFSALSNFKDKILTVIFDNQQRLSQRISIKTPKRRRYKRPEGNVNKIAEESRKKQKRSHLYDKNTNVISDIYDDRGEKIKKLYNPDGKVIEELYSASGTLVKNKVLRNMFEKNVFKPKAFDSEGNIITTIYANKKALKKVYDENGEPARLDSDLVYLVSKQSLPDDKPALLKPAPKQVNYFSEGSTYPFPEGQNQNSQIKNQQLIEELNYETEMEVAFNGYPRRRTDDCTCENCQKLGNNRKNIVQFGGELLNRSSRFTIPSSKFLPRNFLRRYEDFDDTEGEVDSLETFIDQAGKQDVCVEAEEYYGNSPEVRQESDENVPISRKMIENTLKNCVHFNSSTNAIGKVSDTVLQHFANSISHEIEQKFYHKLNISQYSENHSEDSSHVFQCDDEKDICIGTELKFEDELIGKHNSAQTTDISTGKCHICESSLESFDQNPEELYGYYDPNSIGPESVNDKAFVCKVPNLHPFIMTMKSKIRKI